MENFSGRILRFLCMLGLFLTEACHPHEDVSLFYCPADFELSGATCFIWSGAHQEIIPRLASLISQKDKVIIFAGENVNDTVLVHATLGKYQANFQNIKVIGLKSKPSNIWIRDFGPVYLITREGKVKVVSFNYFGTNPKTILDVPDLEKYPVLNSSMISTGGSREVNGKGTLILVEAHEMDVNRPKTKQEIEKELAEKLGIKNFIWLKQGIPQDDNPLRGALTDQIYPNGINGHVDEFCRFADPRTILISSVTEREAKQHPILAEAKRRLDENYNILIRSKDQNGKKFRVIKVPYAPLQIVDRSTDSRKIFVAPVTSYMNFIITHSMIILPSYLPQNSNQKALQIKEEEVLSILRKVFPKKDVKMVPVGGLNYFSGGFHCLSYNEPRIGD